MQRYFVTQSAEATRAVGQQVARDIVPHTVLCLSGELGSGKTTFTRGFLEALGASGPYSSPTFVLMKQYDLPTPIRGIERIYHTDAYRVEEKDFESLGFAEWCSDTRGIVILEWPERVAELIPSNALRITFISTGEIERTITLQ